MVAKFQVLSTICLPMFPNLRSYHISQPSWEKVKSGLALAVLEVNSVANSIMRDMSHLGSVHLPGKDVKLFLLNFFGCQVSLIHLL